jgi:hypothetical protein
MTARLRDLITVGEESVEAQDEVALALEEV